MNGKHGAKEYLYIRQEKLDRKNAEYVKETTYDRHKKQLQLYIKHNLGKLQLKTEIYT